MPNSISSSRDYEKGKAEESPILGRCAHCARRIGLVVGVLIALCLLVQWQHPITPLGPSDSDTIINIYPTDGTMFCSFCFIRHHSSSLLLQYTQQLWTRDRILMKSFILKRLGLPTSTSVCLPRNFIPFLLTERHLSIHRQPLSTHHNHRRYSRPYRRPHVCFPQPSFRFLFLI